MRCGLCWLRTRPVRLFYYNRQSTFTLWFLVCCEEDGERVGETYLTRPGYACPLGAMRLGFLQQPQSGAWIAALWLLSVVRHTQRLAYTVNSLDDTKNCSVLTTYIVREGRVLDAEPREVNPGHKEHQAKICYGGGGEADGRCHFPSNNHNNARILRGRLVKTPHASNLTDLNPLPPLTGCSCTLSLPLLLLGMPFFVF